MDCGASCIPATLDIHLFSPTTVSRILGKRSSNGKYLRIKNIILDINIFINNISEDDLCIHR